MATEFTKKCDLCGCSMVVQGCFIVRENGKGYRLIIGCGVDNVCTTCFEKLLVKAGDSIKSNAGL